MSAVPHGTQLFLLAHLQSSSSKGREMTWKDRSKTSPRNRIRRVRGTARSARRRGTRPKDANLDQLSADRRFATAYNAVLQLTKMGIACEGYV